MHTDKEWIRADLDNEFSNAWPNILVIKLKPNRIGDNGKNNIDRIVPPN